MSRLCLIALTGLLLALAGCTARQVPATGPAQNPAPTPDAAPIHALVTPVEAAPTVTLQGTVTPVPTVPFAVAPATPTAAEDDGLTPDQRQLLASLPSRGPAPELRNEIWLNSTPLRLAELRGRVVLLDMWTYG